MKNNESIIGQKKNIVLVAHDNKKGNLLEGLGSTK
jgi:methylglyoxal synthase